MTPVPMKPIRGRSLIRCRFAPKVAVPGVGSGEGSPCGARAGWTRVGRSATLGYASSSSMSSLCRTCALRTSSGSLRTAAPGAAPWAPRGRPEAPGRELPAGRAAGCESNMNGRRKIDHPATNRSRDGGAVPVDSHASARPWQSRKSTERATAVWVSSLDCCATTRRAPVWHPTCTLPGPVQGVLARQPPVGRGQQQKNQEIR